MEYNYRLNPDWTQGLVAEDAPVRLYRAFGSDEGFPSDMPDRRFWPKMARVCEVKKTKITVGDPNPLDFFGEFPVREILGVNFKAPFVLPEGYEDPGPIRVPRGPEKKLDSRRNTMTLLEEIPEEEFAPWLFSGKAYDRPITRCQVWIPDGWPEKTTAVKLTEPEVERYRSRDALALEPADIVDIELEIDHTKHARTLPPPSQPGSRPRIRILAVRAEQNDYSTLPYTEFWLFSRCEYQDRPCWRALAHIVSFDGDVMYGRETFGYPSKHGEPEMTVSPMQVDLRGRRCMRDFLHATIPLSLDAPQKINERFEFLGIRTIMLRDFENYDSEDFGERFHATARYITQPWNIEIPEARSAWPEQVHLVLPDEPGIGRIGRPDPWYEFSDGRVVRCVAGRGAIRRFPGSLRGDFDWQEHHRFLADHYESEDNNAIRPSTVSFLVGDTAS
jgi:hypothetical protein